MRIWSIQPEKLYEELKFQRVLYCDPMQSELITQCGFGPAYDWMAQQMRNRVGIPPKGVLYPFWAWHTIEWKHQRPDLRHTEFRAYKSNQACLELEIPGNMVLLSNEDMWHIVLNDGYYGDSSNEQEAEMEDRWFESLPLNEKATVKMKSWEKIFSVSPPHEDEWECHGKYIQATFWELRLDHVIAVRHFKGRLKNKIVADI